MTPIPESQPLLDRSCRAPHLLRAGRGKKQEVERVRSFFESKLNASFLE